MTGDEDGGSMRAQGTLKVAERIEGTVRE